MDGQRDDRLRQRAKADADRRHHVRLASTLAVYLHEGGAYALTQALPGSGAGVAGGELRICIDVDAARFWRTYAALERRRARHEHRP